MPSEKATNILILGSSVVDPDYMKNKLEEMGYGVCTIISDEKEENFLEKIETIKPSLILINLELLDGKELVKQIKSKTNIPIIIITDKINFPLKETKPYEYITKPLTERELSCNIEIALDKYKQQNKLKNAQRSNKTIFYNIENVDDEIWFYNKLFEQLPDSVIITNLEGYIIKWLAKSEQIFGYKSEEVIGKKLDFICQDNYKSEKITELSGEVICTKNDGEELIIEISFNKLYNEDNEPLFLIWTSKDITEQKKIEKAMDNFYDSVNTELESMVKEQTTELSGQKQIEKVMDGFYDSVNAELERIVARRTAELSKANELLEEYNRNLEEKVIQRTRELQEQNERMLKELEMAQRVQLGIIPSEQSFPKRKELNFASRYLSMEKIGGDLYDIIRIGKNGYGILMADVSGHGVPAALITTMAKVSFNNYSHWNVKPSEVCTKVNKEMFQFIGDLGYYFSAYYAIVNLETAELQYTNAGHHPAVLFKANSKEIKRLDSEDCLIGIFENVNYRSGSIKLEKGDRILLFTDGIIEGRNKEGDFYKYKRLLNYVQENAHLPIKDFVKGLIDDLDAFCEGRPADDDRAVLCIEFISTLAPDETKISKALQIEGARTKDEPIKSSIKDLYKMSIKYFKEKKYNEALELLLELKTIYPSNVKLLNSLGIVYYKLNLFEEAYKILKEASSIDKNNETVKKNLSLVFKKIEK